VSHSVLCGDFAHYQDPDEEWAVHGFRTEEAAAEYARRFVRDQVEHLRSEYPDPEALEQAFLMFGEYAMAPGFVLRDWLAYCIANPAAGKADTDYQALDPSS
jgi:hypothetical protein